MHTHGWTEEDSYTQQTVTHGLSVPNFPVARSASRSDAQTRSCDLWMPSRPTTVGPETFRSHSACGDSRAELIAQGQPRVRRSSSCAFEHGPVASATRSILRAALAMPFAKLDVGAPFNKRPLDISPENRQRFEDFLRGIIEDESRSAKDVEELHRQSYVRAR